MADILSEFASGSPTMINWGVDRAGWGGERVLEREREGDIVYVN